MPWLLYRYILGELLRVFGITAAVLVLVTAFGAAIKPLAADDLLGPFQTAKYITLAIVPMMQFALPFAAGFASTLVLHRMTSDNEILAAAVGGISYRRILVPLVSLGLVLLVVMVLLTQWVIPRFWRLMERNLAADITRVFQASIAKGRPFSLGDWQIYADDMDVQFNPPDTEADERWLLTKLAAAETNKEGRIVADVTAVAAAVDVHRRGRRTYLMLAARDTVFFDDNSGQLSSAKELTPNRAIAIPGVFQDDPMFKTQRELLELRDHPDRSTWVRDAKQSVAEIVRLLDIWKQLGPRLEAKGHVDLQSENGRVTVFADRLKRGRFSTIDGRPVRVREYKDGAPWRQASSADVSLRKASGFTLDDPSFDLVLVDCEVTELTSDAAPNRRGQHHYPDLSIPGLEGSDPTELPYRQLIQLAEGSGREAGVTNLRRRIHELRLEILSRLLRRYALSITAVLLLVLGATLAMWLRDSLPLMIYVWAFAPSIANVLLISGGDHMIRNGLILAGVLVMWSGNVLLLLAQVVAFTRLARH